MANFTLRLLQTHSVFAVAMVMVALLVLVTLAPPHQSSSSSPIIVASAFQLLPRRQAKITARTIPSTILQSITTITKKESTCTKLQMATVSPDDSNSNTVGILGRGYIAWLTAKIAAHRGYNTWMICFKGQEPTIRQLLSSKNDGSGDGDDIPENLSIVKASDSDIVDSYLSKTNAMIVAADAVDDVLNDELIQYILDPEKLPTKDNKFHRVVGMSRNLNGKGMGFFVSASRRAANADVWDGSTTAAYKAFEKTIQECANKCGADYTIARAGTLKGGACGDASRGGDDTTYHPQFLNSIYYEMTNNDVAKWQLLFDCDVRGVKLTKGDVLPGPGAKAVLTAISEDACPGDTSRGSLADAMVRSLEVEAAANMDFGIGTEKGRSPPNDSEWTELFQALEV